MCNLYSQARGREAIGGLFRYMRDATGGAPLRQRVYPDNPAPIVRTRSDGELELVIARWGMPCPPQYGNRPITNIRNTSSAHWRRWLGPANRCLVPFTAFSEYADRPDPATGRKPLRWFALGEDRPLSVMAGLWCSWTGTRGTKANPIEGEHTLYGFLTTEPNAIVRPIHAKAMPVILTTQEEMDMWMRAPAEIALQLQRPLDDHKLQLVDSDEIPTEATGQEGR